ncbi:hypothetical protein ACOZB2_03955 [Pantoea endophytica]|uniref:Uncharacterized protein n=1 Tax=Pantoea sp. BJ2 TaxID=3141322 RepID=A0AAU7U3J6_9GAMM
MKNNIYEFSVGERKDIISSDKKKRERHALFLRVKNTSGRLAHSLSFYLRLALATALHAITCIPFAALLALRKFIFWIGGAICVVTWYQLDHQFVSSTNLTIPFFVGLYVTSLMAPAVLAFLNSKFIWHKLLGLAPVESQKNDE